MVEFRGVRMVYLKSMVAGVLTLLFVAVLILRRWWLLP
jgi:hypothetical protein